jgi:hypothetical protein
VGSGGLDSWGVEEGLIYLGLGQDAVKYVLPVAVLGAVARWVRVWRVRRRGPAGQRLARQVPDFRVVALGPQGAGKTLLLASMYHHLQTPSGGHYYLTAPYDQVVQLNKWFADVADPSRGWPYGTAVGETREFTFEVTTRTGGEPVPVLRLGYLEYAGELLTEPQAPGSTVQADLFARVEAAHALIGIIDGNRVRQVLQGDGDGHWRLQQALTAMIAPMMRVRCPITFVITKWDLLAGVHADEDTRLSIVRNLLMSNQGFRDLVRTHAAHRVVRLVPVSAVGPTFARLDESGLVTKRPDGQVRPTNIDVPLSAVVPDVFEQVERSLDEATRRAVLAEARRQAHLTPRRALTALASFVSQHAGSVLAGSLGLRGVAGLAGQLTVGLFLDSRMAAVPQQPALAERLGEAERRLHEFHLARRVVLRELQGRVDRLEGRLPSSRLSGEL